MPASGGRFNLLSGTAGGYAAAMLPIDHLYRTAHRIPDAVAIVDGDTEMTYGELIRKVDALAAACQDMDPQPLTRLGICAANSVDHLLAWAAAFAAGKTWVPLNPRLGQAELNGIVGATQPTIVVVDDLDDLSAGGASVVLVDGSGERTVAGLIGEYDGRRPLRHTPEPDDVQAVKFTGGSSGRPKGVMQTYRVWNTCIATLIASYGLAADERHLLAMPLTHGANTLILPTFSVGGTQVLMGPAKPPAILDAFEAQHITSVFLPPTVLYLMMAVPGVEARSFPSLRHVIVGASAIRPEAVPQAMALFNNAIESCFGQTEAPMIIACMRADEWRDPRNHASCGRPTLLTRVAIMDGAGNLLEPGETGEIVVRGDMVMKGYLGMPEKTAETIVDGWLHTGDIGFLDERGYLFIRDRMSDMVISGGFNVYPNDVEAVLGRHPAVRDCAVYGAPDETWGERVEAAVELHDGAAADAAEIIGFVKAELDSVKAPKRIHMVDELPRNSLGKVLRREARRLFADAS